ncbi:MAG: electron transfer flavoprotein subunit beta/FixA family protein [Dehalococcoidia bacterium]|nr:electron transfer flavoprotein subunit beta/FixA family protein [Dehalococcoidia bacterium]
MHIIVLVKQVPDIEKVQFKKDTGWVDRSSADSEINPFDLNALEAAQRMKETLGATVTVLSMGPATAEAVVKEGVARDADRGILLTDDKFAGADTLATSYALAAAIKKIGAFDLLLCGEKTVDGDTGQVGPAVAERLGIPHLSFVSQISDCSEDKITAVTETASGSVIVESGFPVLISGTKELNVPRLPTLKDKLRARKSEVEKWSASDLSDVADISKFGVEGSATWVESISVPPEKKRKGEVLKGEDAAASLVAAIDKDGLLKG